MKHGRQYRYIAVRLYNKLIYCRQVYYFEYELDIFNLLEFIILKVTSYIILVKYLKLVTHYYYECITTHTETHKHTVYYTLQSKRKYI